MRCNVTRPKGMQDTDLLFSDSASKTKFSFANSTNMSSKSYQLQTKSEVTVFIMIRVGNSYQFSSLRYL